MSKQIELETRVRRCQLKVKSRDEQSNRWVHVLSLLKPPMLNKRGIGLVLRDAEVNRAGRVEELPCGCIIQTHWKGDNSSLVSRNPDCFEDH